ncbi:MAG: hypothetical protein V3T72_01280, partial [Thermoanaerobaculia bacterium]
DIFNPGGNRAIISTTTFFLDYGIADRFTVSLMVPYVNKDQTTNRFGERVAEGIGDVAVFGRYEALVPTAGIGPSLSLGLGLKFPTGSIEEPGGGVPRLPPAFQVGSGAYDLLPNLSYFQTFSKLSLFGSVLVRIPLESNEVGYRFGAEREIHFGTIVSLPVWNRRLQLTFSLDYLDAEHDEDGNTFLPVRLRDGTKVLNTGGQFLDFTPGLRLTVSDAFTLHARFFIPVSEDWNGLASRNVGQVAPDLTTQLTLSINF